MIIIELSCRAFNMQLDTASRIGLVSFAAAMPDDVITETSAISPKKAVRPLVPMRHPAAE
jgi:hypothetical protein